MSTDEHSSLAASSVDLDRPSAARIYDWYLGGAYNWAVDREFGQQAVHKFPLIRPMAWSNRRWLGRVVRHALDQGITQFLDIGSGIPTVGNVHHIVADTIGPEHGRVVYVDSEPVAASHSQLILERDSATGWAGIVQEDLRSPTAIWQNPTTQRLLDPTRPVCVLMVSVLHFIGGQDDVASIVSHHHDRLVPGSWLALSHITVDDAPADGTSQLQALAEAYSKTQNPAWIRERSEVNAWFQPFTLIMPGLVHLTDWRPDDNDDPSEHQVRPFYWCGVGEVR